MSRHVLAVDTYNVVVSVQTNLTQGNKSNYEQWRTILEMRDPNDSAHMLFQNLWKKMEFCRYDPALASLQIPSELGYSIDLSHFFELMEKAPDLEVCFVALKHGIGTRGRGIGAHANNCTDTSCPPPFLSKELLDAPPFLWPVGPSL